ncbi:hypothetical protein EJD97_008828, partial [Solanum chilense]
MRDLMRSLKQKKTLAKFIYLFLPSLSHRPTLSLSLFLSARLLHLLSPPSSSPSPDVPPSPDVLPSPPSSSSDEKVSRLHLCAPFAVGPQQVEVAPPPSLPGRASATVVGVPNPL